MQLRRNYVESNNKNKFKTLLFYNLCTRYYYQNVNICEVYRHNFIKLPNIKF